MAVTASPACTRLPPLAVVYQPVKAYPGRLAVGSAGYDPPIVVKIRMFEQVPPLALNPNRCSVVQCAKSVREGQEGGTTSVSSTCVPPTRWVNHPTKACPANVAMGKEPYCSATVYVRDAAAAVPSPLSKDTVCTSLGATVTVFFAVFPPNVAWMVTVLSTVVSQAVNTPPDVMLP